MSFVPVGGKDGIVTCFALTVCDHTATLSSFCGSALNYQSSRLAWFGTAVEANVCTAQYCTVRCSTRDALICAALFALDFHVCCLLRRSSKSFVLGLRAL